MSLLLILVFFLLNAVRGAHEEAILTPRDVANPEDMLKSVSISKKDQLKIHCCYGLDIYKMMLLLMDLIHF